MPIYFDDEAKREVLARLASELASDGYLVLGASETTTGSSAQFASAGKDQNGVFTLKPLAAEAAA